MAAAVNKPMDLEKKEADINRKLQLYGIFAGFRNGKVPSNDQVDVALNSFLASISNPPAQLSTDGKQLVADLRDVITQAKYLALSKNQGNLLQDFVWQTRHFDPKAISTPNSPVNKDAAKKDGSEAVEGFRTLGTLVITNGQFRKLLKDVTILIRDMAGDAASNAASRVRPSDDQLSQIDHPADDNTWHDAPKFSKEDLKNKTTGMYRGNLKADAQAAASATSGSPSDAPAARDTLQQRMDENLDPKAKQKLEETKETAKAKSDEYKRRVREYMARKVPQERKDQTIWRLKKMILECQQHPDYSRAVTTLLDLATQYGSHGRAVAREASGTAKGTRTGMAAAEADLKTLIERFANGTSSDDLWASIDQLYQLAEQDQELREWFKSMDRFVRRLLLEQGFVLEDASTREWDRLHSQGRHLLREKYRSNTDRVLDEVKFLGEQFDADPQNRAFSLSVQKLFSDLGHDAEGNATFKPHLLKDLTQVIVPAILENVSYIPVPRIEYQDPNIEAVVENLVIESDNFMPNMVEVFSENYFKWGRRDIASSHKNALELTVKGVQMDMRDVSYYIRRKNGFPAITDKGVADILLPGDGFGFHIKMRTAEAKDRTQFFVIDKVRVDFRTLKIQFRKSNHKFLFSVLKPLVLRAMRPILQMVAEKQLKVQAAKLDALLYQIKQDADAATAEVREDPSKARGVYQRYMSAAKARLFAEKNKAEEKTADKEFRVAMTKEESMFPAIDLPGGISTKATEYRDMARRGDGWQSDVFSIGTASRSHDIPQAPRIERKAHSHGHANGNGNPAFAAPSIQ